VLCVESFLNRVKYLEKDNKSQNRCNWKYFEDKFGKSDLSQKIIELYIIRDIIVHNYIWVISYEPNEKWVEKNAKYILITRRAF